MTIDRKRPKRDMGKDWKRLHIVTTPDTAEWVASEAKRQNTSKTAFVDDLLSKAKWGSRASDKN